MRKMQQGCRDYILNDGSPAMPCGRSQSPLRVIVASLMPKAPLVVEGEQHDVSALIIF
jgi:hypothetical protein